MLTPDASTDVGQNVADHMWFTLKRHDEASDKLVARYAEHSDLARWPATLTWTHSGDCFDERTLRRCRRS